MSKKKLSKLLVLYLPYVVIGLLATNLGEAWRLAVGKELGDKIVSLMDTLPAAFSNPLPSLHPLDLLVGLCCGAGLRLAVYLRGKNAKKYRHGMEYGSARWGTPKDIEPFMAPKFEDNIPEAFSGLLQQTYHRFGWEYGMAAYTDPAKPFPTFADVLAGVEDYVAHHARYGPEVRQNLTGALELRAETMTSGALGRVFADPFGMTAKQLLTVPTVLELADFSEEATAFLMNILMFRFQSYLQRLPESSALQRLIVLEEAHNVFRKTDAEDSALARSNLAFDKMFAEIRASGTGLVLSDQRPSLMPDSVMANTAVKLCLGMDSGEDRGCMGSVMDLSVLQRRALHAFRPGECLMTVRGTHGVFHLQTEKPGTSGSFTAACLVCGSRFRCRKSAVQGLLAPLDAGQMQYHLARIRADPYNIPVLAENIEQMLQQLRITAAAPTKLCLLGEMLAGAGVPLGESRQIVTAYHNHLKGGTV